MLAARRSPRLADTHECCLGESGRDPTSERLSPLSTNLEPMPRSFDSCHSCCCVRGLMYDIGDAKQAFPPKPRRATWPVSSVIRQRLRNSFERVLVESA